jgi:two-component system response regulator
MMETSHSSWSAFRIFVAEDDLDDQFLLQEAFDQFAPHVQLFFFVSGDELLRALGSIQPDSALLPHLIITDLNMPKIDGYKVIQYVRTHPYLGTVPVVVLSTTRNLDSHQRAISLGAVASWVKPTSVEEYKEIIKQLLTLLNHSTRV